MIKPRNSRLKDKRDHLESEKAGLVEALKDAKEHFESITCKCGEGPDVMRNIDIIESTLKEALEAYQEIKSALARVKEE